MEICTLIISIISILLAVYSLNVTIFENRKLNNDRALKDCYIKDIEDIREQYNSLIRKISNHGCSSEYIISQHKSLQMRINSLNTVVIEEYPLSNLKSVSDSFSSIKYFITSHAEFEKQFQEKNIIFSSHTVQNIYEQHSNFRNEVFRFIAKLNKI